MFFRILRIDIYTLSVLCFPAWLYRVVQLLTFLEGIKMGESRRIKRNEANAYLGIYDRESNMLVGRLTDITALGMQVLSYTEIGPTNDLSLKLELPFELSGQRWIEMNAKCIWCRPDNTGKYYHAGFQFRDISEQNAKLIEELINCPVFKNGMQLKKELVGPKK